MELADVITKISKYSKYRHGTQDFVNNLKVFPLTFLSLSTGFLADRCWGDKLKSYLYRPLCEAQRGDKEGFFHDGSQFVHADYEAPAGWIRISFSQKSLKKMSVGVKGARVTFKGH